MTRVPVEASILSTFPIKTGMTANIMLEDLAVASRNRLRKVEIRSHGASTSACLEIEDDKQPVRSEICGSKMNAESPKRNG